METKRLYRSVYDRKLAGVAGGLAEYFVMDPLLIRLAFIILMLAGGGGFLIYIILWIVTPENPRKIEPSRNPSEQYAQAAPENPGNFSEGQSDAGTGQAPITDAPPLKERGKGSLIGGLVLITLGGLFLADELLPRFNFEDLWPVILIVIGIGLLINVFIKRNQNTNQH